MERRIAVVLVFIISLQLISCQEIKYPEPQPNWKSEKKHFPKKMQGNYLNEEGEKAITIDAFRATLNDPDEFISSIDLRVDTVMLKKWRGIWFVNIKEKEDRYWNVAFVELEKDTLILSYMSESIEVLEKLTKVQREGADSEGDYIINPERKEWKEILDQMTFTSTKYIKN
jgi:hypothetical protein